MVCVCVELNSQYTSNKLSFFLVNNLSLACFATWSIPCWNEHGEFGVSEPNTLKKGAVGVSENRSLQHVNTNSLLLQNNRQIGQITLPSFSLCRAGTIFLAFTIEGSSWFKHLGRTTKESHQLDTDVLTDAWLPGCSRHLHDLSSLFLPRLYHLNMLQSTAEDLLPVQPQQQEHVQRLSDQSENFQPSLYQAQFAWCLCCHMSLDLEKTRITRNALEGTGHWANCSCTDLWNLRSTGRITPQAFWKQLDPTCVTEMFVQVNSLKHFVGGGRFNCGCREKSALVFYRIYLMLRFPRP